MDRSSVGRVIDTRRFATESTPPSPSPPLPSRSRCHRAAHLADLPGACLPANLAGAGGIICLYLAGLFYSIEWWQWQMFAFCGAKLHFNGGNETGGCFVELCFCRCCTISAQRVTLICYLCQSAEDALPSPLPGQSAVSASWQQIDDCECKFFLLTFDNFQ